MARTQQTGAEGGRFTGVINNEALARHVRDIEELLDERKTLNDRIKEIYQAAKEAGFQTPILREIIRERKLDEEVRADRYALLDAYRRALGMLADTPLGQAAMAAAVGDKPKTPDEAIEAARQHLGTNGASTGAKRRKPFAEQPLGTPRRGRSRRVLFDREHPEGTA